MVLEETAHVVAQYWSATGRPPSARPTATGPVRPAGRAASRNGGGRHLPPRPGSRRPPRAPPLGRAQAARRGYRGAMDVACAPPRRSWAGWPRCWWPRGPRARPPGPASFPFPPLGLAQRLLRLVPGPVAVFFIDWLGHWALRLFAVGFTVGSILAGGRGRGPGGQGAGGRRGRAATWLAAGGLPVVALAGYRAQPGRRRCWSTARWWPWRRSPTPVSWGALAWSATRSRRRPAGWDGPGGSCSGPPSGRPGCWPPGSPCAGSPAGSATPAGSPWPGRPAPPRSARRRPRGRRRPGRLGDPGLTAEVTSNRLHYTVDESIIDPNVDRRSWRLRVEAGRPAGQPRLRRVAGHAGVEQYVTLQCISNLVGGTWWARPSGPGCRWPGAGAGRRGRVGGRCGWCSTPSVATRTPSRWPRRWSRPRWSPTA